MATPEDTPTQFDIELEKREVCSLEFLADQVLWPLVDKLARRDWRNDAEIGHEFRFPGRAKVGKTVIDAFLTAGCDMYEDKRGRRRLCSVNFQIEERKFGLGRSIAIANFKPVLPGSDEVEESSWRALGCTAFYADTDNDISIANFLKFRTHDEEYEFTFFSE